MMTAVLGLDTRIARCSRFYGRLFGLHMNGGVVSESVFKQIIDLVNIQWLLLDEERLSVN
jgi:hypothetical protein